MAFCKQWPTCYQVTSKIKEATQVRQHPQTFGNTTHNSRRVEHLKRRRNTVHRWHCLLSNCPTQHKLGKTKIPMEMHLFDHSLGFCVHHDLQLVSPCHLQLIPCWASLLHHHLLLSLHRESLPMHCPDVSTVSHRQCTP